MEINILLDHLTSHCESLKLVFNRHGTLRQKVWDGIDIHHKEQSLEKKITGLDSPLYITFIDFQNDFDSLDGSML